VSPGTSSSAASTISIRFTLPAGIACSAVTGLVDLPDIRSPLSRNVAGGLSETPLAVFSPRMLKPGTWFSISSAVRGANRVKSAGA
jgi:hypothetical protein